MVFSDPGFLCILLGFRIWSPNSCLSWLSSSQDSDLVGPPNPWFDFYNRAPPSPTSSVETDPNWGKILTSKDEEIRGLFDLHLNLQDLYIKNLFSSSDEESLDDDDLVSDFDVGAPFSRMDTSFLFNL